MCDPISRDNPNISKAETVPLSKHHEPVDFGFNWFSNSDTKHRLYVTFRELRQLPG